MVGGEPPKNQNRRSSMLGLLDANVNTPAGEETAMESSVISRHWPTCSDRTRVTVDGVAEGTLRGIIRELADLRTQMTLEGTVDAKVVRAMEALREAEEAQRTPEG
jgi:hypothetical protein